MTDRRILNLLYVVLALVVANLGATFYFQLTKSQASAATSSNASTESPLISGKDATDFAKSVIDVYNTNDMHDLYLKFDDQARLKFTEQDLSEKLSKLHGMIGTVGDFAYSNASVAGKEGDVTYLVLNYSARLNGGTFKFGTVKLTVAMKDGHPSLFGFFITGQAE